MTPLAVLTEDQLAALLERAAERGAERALARGPKGGNEGVLVPFREAARRLGLSLRSIQARAKDGRIEVVEVGGERLCRLPAGVEPG